MFKTNDAKEIAAKLFGIQGTITRLDGEYDFNFHIKKEDGNEFLLKISNGEDYAILLMQNDALNKLRSSKTSFDFPKLNKTLTNEEIGIANSSEGTFYYVRLFSFVKGIAFRDIHHHSDELLASLGCQLGQLTQVLYPIRKEAAKRYLKWDLQKSSWIRNHLHFISNQEDQALIEFFLGRFESNVLPKLPYFRQSLIHGDINDDNTLVSFSSPHHFVSGFIDFGDLIETATICELAIAIAYAIFKKSDPLAAAYIIIKNYHAKFPLFENEIDVLYELIAIRLCLSVVNSACRKKEEPNNLYLTNSETKAWQLLKKWRDIHPPLARYTFRDACQMNACSNTPALFPSATLSDRNLIARLSDDDEEFPRKISAKSEIKQLREQYVGKNVLLSYDEPLQIVRGIRQYLFDENGRPYLDCINNVSHVGHCHPKVVLAGQKQMALLNTNTRYLHDHLTTYAKRLVASLPNSLQVCFFVSSGSEANELALRLARAYTGRNHWLVMDNSYHGNTTTLINLSPYKFNGPGGDGKPDFVQVLPMPDPLRNPHGLPILPIHPNTAAFICESLLSCGGQIVLPDQYLKQIYAAVRKVGGVCIADEIQIGLGRCGSHFWGFETQEVVPDILTLGKPLGNGHPLGAVVTTREIAESFCNGMEYFNTFGGNPVSCAIGLSVLDVLLEENLQANALSVGNYLKQKLMSLKEKYPRIADVRGLGLFLGIELIKDRQSRLPDKELTSYVVNKMKECGILLSADGPYRNVIKVKPPLCFTKENSDFLVNHLDRVLSSTLSRC